MTTSTRPDSPTAEALNGPRSVGRKYPAAGEPDPGEHPESNAPRQGHHGWQLHRGGRLPPGAAIALYIVVGVVWIALSDELAGLIIGDAEAHAQLHIALSWAFILASAAFMLALVRRAVGTLQLSERIMRSTIQSMADPVLLLDLAGNVIDANRAAVEVFGVDDKRELLMHIHALGDRFDLRYADGRKVPFDRYASDAALAGHVVRQYEGIIRRNDGRDLFISISAAPVQEREGAPTRMAVTVLHDIDKLKQLEKLRDDFLSVAAHELKTPVATVKGYAQLLQRGPAKPETSLNALGVIVRQCDRLDRRVHEMLEYSRLRGNRLRLAKEPLDLTSLASEAVRHMQVATAAKHRLAFDGDPGAVVECDRERIDQVLGNLLDNAVKYSPAGGEIAVRVERRVDEVVLSVRDQGIGIAPDHQPHIFEQYYRACAGQVRGGTTGMGVGLYLAREIVALHGGRIWFSSSGTGDGTTFFIALPSAAAPSSGPSAGAGGSAPSPS